MLFQPTSITPDYLGGIGNGVVRPDVPLAISWLVNGNSAMVAFKIDYYTNDAASSIIRTTGRLTTGCPFYGTDAQGNRQFFTYVDEVVNLSLHKEWKMVITQWWSADDYVVQSSPSVFTVKEAPSLYLTPPGTVTTRDYTFTAQYSQADGDALNWVRWKVAINTEEGRENPLYDSGNIYGTALLECYYDGFLCGTTYCVKCIAETQSGILIDTEWLSFACDYPQEELTGTVTASQLPCGESGVLVEWDGFRYISGEADGDYEIADGILNLPSDSSVTWDEVNGSDMSFATPWNILYKGTLQKEDATLFEVGQGTHKITLEYTVSNRTLTLKRDTTVLKSITTVAYEDTISAILTPTTLYIRRDTMEGGLYPSTTLYPGTTIYPSKDKRPAVIINSYAVTYTQAAVTALKVYGEQECDYLQLVRGTLAQSVIDAQQTEGVYTPEAVPGTEFLADFVNELNAGTLYIAGTEIDGWAIYRQQKDNPVLMHITNTVMTASAIHDYSACSQQGPYKYYVYPIGTDKYITSPLISNEVYPVFWNWSILECSLNDEGSYEVVNEFLFGKNLETGAMSNNNKPAIFENFTRFPHVQISPQRYKSGTLSSYIGTVKAGEYTDTIEQREAIDLLSTTTNSLFLKSRKGDLWEIRLSDAISYDTMDNSLAQAVTASISWVQIADASETSIIKSNVKRSAQTV